MSPPDAVRALADAGALPVMAHPTFSLAESDGGDLNKLKPALSELREAGLAGMEVYYKDYTPMEVGVLARIADELGIIPCGGSDYHAAGNPGEPEPGTVGPPMETVDRLRALLAQRRAGVD